MKLIKPYYEILNENDLIKLCKEIELVARTCYKSENKITDDSNINFIEKLIKLNHEAMLEFGPSIVVKFVCDRGVSHELVRHRLCDFAQESTRYCNYSKDKFENQITFVIPNWMPDVNPGEYNNKPTMLTWMIAMENAEKSYLQLLKEGWQPQQARTVLPNSLKTEIVVKANVREWRHIFKLRCSSAAHPQMRELMIPLLKHFKMYAAPLFSDINYE